MLTAELSYDFCVDIPNVAAGSKKNTQECVCEVVYYQISQDQIRHDKCQGELPL